MSSKIPQFASRADIASVLNVTPDIVRRGVEPLLPDACKRKGARGSVELDVAAAVQAFINRLNVSAGDERLELIRAQTEKLRLEIEERKGRLVPVEHFDSVLNAFADLTRTATDRLQREVGAKAATAWNECVEDAMSTLVKRIEDLEAAASKD